MSENSTNKDDMEKDIFLGVVAEELKKIKEPDLKEAIDNKARSLFALIFDFSKKGLLADPKEIKRKLQSLIEEE
ncbi:MAG: hypothetical protein QXL94_04015 [Candidatus Parvarchaeum sp.]